MKKIIRVISCLIYVSLLILFPAMLSPAVAGTIVSGTAYPVSNIPAAGKVSAFNGALQLTCSKDTVLVDDEGAEAEDQTVSFVVYLGGGGSPDTRFYTLVSNIYKISVADSDYRLLSPGQLTLAYSSNVSNSVADQLAIWYSPADPEESAGGKYIWDEDYNYNLGGLVNTGNHTVTVPFQLQGRKGYYAVFLAQRSFVEYEDSSDESAWSYPYVMPLWAKGIVERLPVEDLDDDDYKDYFGLSKDINRLEFTTMLVKGLGLTLSPAPEYEKDQVFVDEFNGTKFYHAEPDDIDETYFGDDYSTTYTTFASSPGGYGYHIYDDDHMPVQFVETAVRHGIVNGFSDRTFKPQAPLTREQAAVILARAANLKISDDDKAVQNGLAKIFEDAGEVKPWAAPSLLAAAGAKLIEGKEGSDSKSKLRRFDPQGNLTRAEGIALTYRLLKKYKKI